MEQLNLSRSAIDALAVLSKNTIDIYNLYNVMFTILYTRHSRLLYRIIARTWETPSRLLNLHGARLGSICISTPHVSHSRLHEDHSSRVYDTRHAAEPHESPTPLLLLWALLREGWLE